MALASGQAAAEDDILVAVAGPMTGQYAAFGRAMKSGGRQAVDKINSDGGVVGRKLQLIVDDDACDKAQAVAVAHRLVAKQVALVVGHHCASASIAAAPIYAAAGIIMISPGTSDPLLTDKRAGPTIFRLAHRDDGEGAVSGAYIARAFAGKRVAILHDRTVVGIRLANDTKRAMNAGGLVETFYSAFIAGERDYSQLARDLRAHHIDIAYLGAYPSEADLIRQALARHSQTIVVVGSQLLAHPSARDSISRDALLLTSLSRPSDNAGAEPHSLDASRAATNTQAAVQVWAQAATVPGQADTVTRALQHGSFKTILGDVAFDKKGDAAVPFFKMHLWKGGELVPAP